MAAFLFACNHKPVEVKLIGEIGTRRTFAGIQGMVNEEEREAYIAKQEKSNPQVGYSPDSILIKQFERLGLIKNNELLQKEFKLQTEQKTAFIDRANRSFPVEFFNDSLTGNVHFKIFFTGDSIEVDTKATSLQDLDYIFLDVIPGGNKELVFLDDYYIMNGYNFDLKVYEIKSN